MMYNIIICNESVNDVPQLYPRSFMVKRFPPTLEKIAADFKNIKGIIYLLVINCNPEQPKKDGSDVLKLVTIQNGDFIIHSYEVVMPRFLPSEKR